MLLSVIFVALFAIVVRAEDSESKSSESESSSEQSHENEQPHKYVEALMDCSIKYQVPPNYFRMVLNGDAPIYDDAKCFVKCGMMGLEYMNEDGSFNEQAVRTVVEHYFTEPTVREHAIETWSKCEQQSHSELYTDDSCERAYNMFKCYSDHMSKTPVVPQP